MGARRWRRIRVRSCYRRWMRTQLIVRGVFVTRWIEVNTVMWLLLA